MRGDQPERHECRGLVEAPELGVHARPPHQAAGHREADRDRDAEHHDRDDPERAAREPEELMRWVDGGHETWVVTGVRDVVWWLPPTPTTVRTIWPPLVRVVTIRLPWL